MDDITLNALNLFSNLVINTFYFLKWLLNFLRLWSAVLFNISVPSGLLALPVATQVAVGNTWGATHLDV